MDSNVELSSPSEAKRRNYHIPPRVPMPTPHLQANKQVLPHGLVVCKKGNEPWDLYMRSLLNQHLFTMENAT